MADFTPTMNVIRNDYVAMRREHCGFTDLYAAEFDRALAAHDSEVAAAAAAKVLDDLRFLAGARAEYDHLDDNDLIRGDNTLILHGEHSGLTRVVEMLTGERDALGWLPSWHWDEWRRRHPELPDPLAEDPS